MSAPAGTVTFLFTDIEGSTQMWENSAAEMQVALARHDFLVRSAIVSCNGTVFKTIGDAFCAAFASAPDALAASLIAQDALAKEPWPESTPIKVRMALHTGEVESRDSDYFGQTVNRVARLLGIGHGGQTLLSKTAHDLVVDDLPEQGGLLDLGKHRLKDLAHPEHVYQFLHPSLATEFAPLRSLDSARLPNNLPEQLTSFVGRETELEIVTDMLSKARMVTLTGSGGCGKTRLAIQVAANISEQFPDGVWYTELAPLSDPILVGSSIAGLLGVREEPGKTIVQTLAMHLRQKKLLIVLDNCEHLLLASAQLAEALLRSCPDVRILATSREQLNIAGEVSHRVPSLTQPDPRRHTRPQELLEFESVRLFLDRAKSVAVSIDVTDQNADALAQLCYQLDGIPLAIELAAARVRSLSVEQIATRLDDRFRLLTGGSRTALPRQQTLRALVDWSYDLLSEPERAMLRRLSVFAGGWTLEVAESVTEGDPVEDWEVLDLLTTLLDKSLVSFELTKSGDRYRMLETVKSYAKEKLNESGEEAETTERHLDWYFRFVQNAGTWVRGPEQKEWLDRLEAEQDNLWLALDSGQRIGEREKCGHLAWTLGVMLQYRGFLQDAVKAVESGISAFDPPAEVEPLVFPRLLYERAGLHQDMGETALASTLANQALVLFEAGGDKAGIARSENLLGQIAMDERDYEEAEARYDRSLSLFYDVGDQLGVSIVRNNQGVLARRNPMGTEEERSSRLIRARDYLTESLQIRRNLRDLMGEAETLNNLGVVAFECRDFHGAWENYRDALRIERELRRAPGIGTALANLGEVAGVMGDQILAMSFMAVSERVLEDIKSPLAGAVHSMLLDMAEGLPPEDIQECIAGARSLPVDASIDQVLEGSLAKV